MQHSGRHHPAGARLEAVGLREIEDAVVALVPVLQAAADIGLGRARLQPEERVVEMVLRGVQLRREVVALRLALLAGQRGMLALLVHVVRDRAHVVEELRVDGPAAILVEHRLADEPGAGLGHGVAEQESLALEDGVAQPLVGRAVVVGRLGRAGEPAFVDAAAMGSQSVPVGRSQLDPLAGMEKTPRHPVGRQPQDAFAGVQRPIHDGPNVILLHDR